MEPVLPTDAFPKNRLASLEEVPILFHRIRINERYHDTMNRRKQITIKIGVKAMPSEAFLVPQKVIYGMIDWQVLYTGILEITQFI